MCNPISYSQYKSICRLLDQAMAGWCYKSEDRMEATNAIRIKFNIRHLSDLQQEDYTAAISFIHEIAERAHLTLKLLAEFKHYALKEVVMGGAPLTQVIIRDYRKQFQSIPPAINWAEMMHNLNMPRALVVGAEVSHA